MHVNIYSTEGGVEGIEAGTKKAKDGKTYPFVGVSFKNGNSVKFFGRTVTEVEEIIEKLNEAFTILKITNRKMGEPIATNKLN